jgi:dienelactone hydrolase
MATLPRVQHDHALIGEAAKIPTTPSTPVFSVGPLALPYPRRIVDLTIKVSAPITGSNLPIILLSHGHGMSNNLSSLNGYGPLANFWAAHGFVVIQSTHLSSKSLSLRKTTSGAPLYWRSRVEDMSFIIDHLSDIESMVPTLQGRLDRSRIAVAGQSLGGHTATILLGATLTDPDTGITHSLVDPRIKAGIVIAAPGNGGSDLSDFAYENYRSLSHPSFAEMKTKALVVVGNQDASPYLSKRGADWRADPFPYTYSPGPKDLLTLIGGEHGLGGIAGYDAKETTDESPLVVAVVQRMTVAWLRGALGEESKAWGRRVRLWRGSREWGVLSRSERLSYRGSFSLKMLSRRLERHWIGRRERGGYAPGT